MDRDDIPEAAPKRPGREPKKPLPRRFYQTVGTGAVEAPADGFAILLDGKGVRTPAKRVLVLPVADLAEAIAAEWRAQAKVIDPATMPLTTLAMTAIDAVAGQEGVVAAEIVRYAGSDMLCYRATGPDTLQRRQRETWDPILGWAKAELGAEFQVTSGVMPVVQPAAGE